MTRAYRVKFHIPYSDTTIDMGMISADDAPSAVNVALDRARNIAITNPSTIDRIEVRSDPDRED